MTKEYIDHPILNTLEDHTDQLKEVKRIVTGLHGKYDKEKRISYGMSEKTIENMEYILYKCLYKVGELSMSIRVIEQTLKDHYTKTYIKSPAMGRSLFIKHYFKLHKPYDDLKENIWKLIFIIDDYKTKHFK